MLCRETPRRRATSTTFQPSCTTASTAWYRCSMTESSTSTAHLLLARPGPRQGDGEQGHCQGSAGATVKDQAEQVSSITRSHVQDQVTPERTASPGTRHFESAPGRTRTSDTRFRKRCRRVLVPSVPVIRALRIRAKEGPEFGLIRRSDESEWGRSPQR